MITTRTSILIAAFSYLVGLALMLALVQLAQAGPPSAVDPVAAADHRDAKPDSIATPSSPVIAPVAQHQPPTAWDKALRSAIAVLSGAGGGILLLAFSRALTAARRQWPRWRRGWVSTPLATLITLATIMGTSMLGGLDWYAALVGAGAALATGRGVAGDAPHKADGADPDGFVVEAA